LGRKEQQYSKKYTCPDETDEDEEGPVKLAQTLAHKLID
jgi:hypothetical protein